MPRWLKITLTIFGSLFFLLIITWLVIAWYVNTHKPYLIKQITEQVNENVNGTVTVKDLDITLLRGFPGVSLTLRNVVLRDSLWAQHHHDLLNARDVFVSVNAYSILKGAVQIRDINVDSASIYLFTDSTGYSNTSMFKKKNADTTEAKGKPKINHLTFTNVGFVFENDTKFKMFRLDLKKLVTVLDYSPTGWEMKANINAKVHDFTFNTHNGSFIKNKTLKAKLRLSYSDAEQKLDIPVQPIKLDDDEINIGGQFDFSQAPASFFLKINAKSIPYKNAVSLVSPNISKKLKLMDLRDPIPLQALIQGRTKFRDTPLVKIAWSTKDNLFITPGGNIEHATFSGNFINEKTHGKGHNDPNSMIQLKSVAGQFQTIPFKATNVVVSNLIYPVIEGHFQSNFPLQKINNIDGAETFVFKTGTALIDLDYKAGLSAKDTTIPFITGDVKIINAGFLYVPRGLPINNSRITLHFTGKNLFVQNAQFKLQHSIVNLSGEVDNFLYLYYRAPERILLDWKVSSPNINLNEFLGFLSKRKNTATASSAGKTSTKISQQNNRLNQALDKSTVRVNATFDKVIYNKFTATDIKAIATIANDQISLKDVQVKASGGKIFLDANIDQRGNGNTISANTKIESVEVRSFFQGFDNFGQDAITDKNLRGSLFADAKMKARISQQGHIVPGSMEGDVSFNLKDGELVNFEPIQKIGNLVFRRRNIDRITFRDIENTLSLKGEKITIPPMHIESSALVMFIEGVYGFKGGTQIFVDVPLRNPKKDEHILDDSLRLERSTKGIVIHLKAEDGSDGKVKISLTGKGKN